MSRAGRKGSKVRLAEQYSWNLNAFLSLWCQIYRLFQLVQLWRHNFFHFKGEIKVNGLCHFYDNSTVMWITKDALQNSNGKSSTGKCWLCASPGLRYSLKHFLCTSGTLNLTFSTRQQCLILSHTTHFLNLNSTNVSRYHRTMVTQLTMYTT